METGDPCWTTRPHHGIRGPLRENAAPCLTTGLPAGQRGSLVHKGASLWATGLPTVHQGALVNNGAPWDTTCVVERGFCVNNGAPWWTKRPPSGQWGSLLAQKCWKTGLPGTIQVFLHNSDPPIIQLGAPFSSWEHCCPAGNIVVQQGASLIFPERSPVVCQGALGSSSGPHCSAGSLIVQKAVLLRAMEDLYPYGRPRCLGGGPIVQQGSRLGSKKPRCVPGSLFVHQGALLFRRDPRCPAEGSAGAALASFSRK